MEKIRLSLTIKADRRAAFAFLLDQEANAGNVISWGEVVRQTHTTFVVTFPNVITVWNLSARWEAYQTQILQA